jgi:putative membrane protein
MARNTTTRQLATIVLAVLGILVLLPLLLMGTGMMGFGSMMGWNHMWNNVAMPGWIFVFVIVLQFLFLGAIIGAGYLLYRGITASGHETDPALEELRLAYARGELDDEEYEQRRDALERDIERGG